MDTHIGLRTSILMQLFVLLSSIKISSIIDKRIAVICKDKITDAKKEWDKNITVKFAGTIEELNKKNLLRIFDLPPQC